MINNNFYKVYTSDIKHIINTDDDGGLVDFLDQLLRISKNENNYKYLLDKFIYISRTNDVEYGWMMGTDYGYNYYCKNKYQDKYQYAGEYLSVIKKRKLKLKKLEHG